MTLRFTLRQLEYFVAVGETGSIALASERVHVSSPSISTAVTQLENELGVELFVRHRAKGLTLTPRGRRLMVEAKRLLDYAEAMRDTAGEMAKRPRGPINVGCLVTLAPFVLSAVRKSFEEAYPDARVTQFEANQLDLLRMLRGAQIDVALTYDLELPKDVEFERLANLPPHALLAADHPWAARKSISLEELQSRPMVLLDLPYSREYFLSLFQDRGLRPLVTERATSLSTLSSLVANGFGYALINVRPRTDSAPDGARLATVPLKGKFRPMVLGLAVASGERKPMVIKAFREHCRKIITTGNIPGMAPFR